MGLKEAAIFAGSVSGMKKSLENLRAIRESKRKTEREEEAFELNKEIKKLEIEKAKKENKISGIEANVKSSILDEMFKTRKKAVEGSRAQQEMAEATQMNDFQSFQSIAMDLSSDDAVQNLLLGGSITSGIEDLPNQQSTQSPPKASSVASNINSRLPFSGSDIFELKKGASPFDSLDEMVQFRKPKEQRSVVGISEEGEIEQLGKIDKDAYVVKTSKNENVQIPASITTESEALEYLTTVKGLPEDEARDIIIGQNTRRK